MAILWPYSLVPFTDPNGDPYAGATAYFFDAGTTTPRTVYQDSALSQPHEKGVTANAVGAFPAVFLPSGDYRLRIETAAAVTIWDIDGISTPIFAETGGGGGGDTPVELLARTGDLKFRYDTSAHSSWVRANGRTIGPAASGASERVNDDCEDLFVYLWATDDNLAVAGGRGVTATGDWAAAKQLSLPDMREAHACRPGRYGRARQRAHCN
jgi:hypothetical protein